jgi:hypothetical protein
MNYLYRWFLIFTLAISSVSLAFAQPQPDAAGQLLMLANQSRAQAGLPPLAWDGALAAAAMKHCERMSVAGEDLEHRYPGELDLTERAAASGAHFSLVEENIAFGQYPAQLHNAWMHSEGHRENLLNPEVDHIGIAVVARGGNIYAVADFSRITRPRSLEQIESEVANLIRSSGLSLRSDATDARRACVFDHGLPNNLRGGLPMFVMRWQSAQPEQLPSALTAHLRSGQYQQAAVGSCPARNVEGGFTQYRVAVLLY